MVHDFFSIRDLGSLNPFNDIIISIAALNLVIEPVFIPQESNGGIKIFGLYPGDSLGNDLFLVQVFALSPVCAYPGDED